jgi:hypothetical protein
MSVAKTAFWTMPGYIDSRIELIPPRNTPCIAAYSRIAAGFIFVVKDCHMPTISPRNIAGTHSRAPTPVDQTRAALADAMETLRRAFVVAPCIVIGRELASTSKPFLNDLDKTGLLECKAN